MPISIDTRLVPIPGVLHHFPIASPLGLLAALPGKWTGSGFNTIFRPMDPADTAHNPTGSDNFLELNLTDETLEFTEIGGEIPNRGFAQTDISLFGLTYLQQISDHNVKDAQGKPAGLHIEPGIWVNIPATSNPHVEAGVARLATIPHGTSLLAQGTATVVHGAPQIDPISITPHFLGNDKLGSGGPIPFPSQTLTNPANGLRSPDADIVGVTQDMVTDPNSVLRNALAGKTINSHIRIDVVTKSNKGGAPAAGDGITDIAFLDGTGAAQNPNAAVAEMRSIFWISDFVDSHGTHGTMLQYSQLVLLNFAPLSWPHVSVANLIKVPTKAPIKEIVDHKQILKHEGKEIAKLEHKELEVLQPGFPIPDPAGIGPSGPAGPAEVAGSHHFIPTELRPSVGDPQKIAAPHDEKPQA